MGGLGSPVCQYLAAAGVGRLILIDDQKAEPSNLNRQVIPFRGGRAPPRYKVESARKKIEAFNSEVEVEALPMKLEEETSFILENADLAVDCLDNPKGRYLLNRICWSAGYRWCTGRWRGSPPRAEHRPGRTLPSLRISVAAQPLERCSGARRSRQASSAPCRPPRS